MSGKKTTFYYNIRKEILLTITLIIGIRILLTLHK